MVGARWLLVTALLTTSALGHASPAAAAPDINCCFELSVDVRQVANLNYGEDLPQPYHGAYQRLRSWSVRSIVEYQETSIRHRPSLVEMSSQGRLATLEASNLSERHVRVDPDGNTTYPYLPIPCHSATDPSVVDDDPFQIRELQAEKSDPKPIADAISLVATKEDSPMLKASAGGLFNSEPPLCEGTADLSLHAGDGADSPTVELPSPKLGFLRVANGGDHWGFNSLDLPDVELPLHGGVSGMHTYVGEVRGRVHISWFPDSQLDEEHRDLRDLKCNGFFCHDDWGT
jgi:hypothetical protein